MRGRAILQREILLPLACALGLLAASAADSQSSPPFQRLPTPAEMARYYPQRALDVGMDGRAVIICTVSSSGALRNCSVASEIPAGFDFGAAALKLTQFMEIGPNAPSGQPTAGARITIPLAFTTDGLRPGDGAFMTSIVQWARQPTLDDVEAVRPVTASQTGYATLECHVRIGPGVAEAERGGLTECAVARESSSRAGVAALKLVPKFQLAPASVAVASGETTVSLNLSWRRK